MKKSLFSVLTVLLGLAVMATSVLAPGKVLAQTADPVLVGAGDIANCSRTDDDATAKLLDNIAGTVFTLGDSVYPDGTADQFTNCYDPTWGRQKARTRPAVGNHDYHVAGAAGYFTYFGQAASPLESNCTSDCKGYYSYNLGAWHIIVLNTEIPHTAGSPQEQWLKADLAANPTACTLAYWHRPRFSSGLHGNATSTQGFWNDLYQYGADVVLNGHDHTYERFAPQNPSGGADPTKGIREFVAGTGGAEKYDFFTIQPNSEVRNDVTSGVLKLTLHSTSYDWQFVPIAGETFTDSGSGNCVGSGSGTAPTPTLSGQNLPTPTATKLATATNTPITTATIAPTATVSSTSDLIFADSFESGNLTTWSAKATDSGDLSVSTSAALVGSQGLKAVIDDNNSISVIDDRPTAEARYRARFYFDPNSISMVSGDAHYIFNGFMGTSNPILRMEFRSYSGTYQIRGRLLNDAGSWVNTSWVTLSDAKHFIELDWRAASNNGGLTVWIDGAQQANLTGVDNDTKVIDRVKLGAVGGVDSGTRGTYYFDAFESRRQTYIGP